jgi:hypothetical protein
MADKNSSTTRLVKKELAKNQGFRSRELNLIRAIIDAHLSKIQEAWNEHCS